MNNYEHMLVKTALAAFGQRLEKHALSQKDFTLMSRVARMRARSSAKQAAEKVYKIQPPRGRRLPSVVEKIIRTGQEVTR